jgi:lambda family phage portal protein
MANALDAVIAFFAPQRALQRTRARMALRIYEGAAVGRRTSSFRGTQSSANTEISGALKPLRDRARELVRNTPHAKRALDIIVSQAIGTGLRPVPRTGSSGLDKRLVDLWRRWECSCDIEERLSFGAMQALAVRSMVESGEIACRFIDVRPNGNASRVPLRLQLLEADFIDQYRDGMYGDEQRLGITPETKRSRLGVGLGDFDRRTGLWLLPWHPGEVTTYNMDPGISRFQPKDSVLHMFSQARPGQVRGVSWFAPIITTTADMSDFADAVRVKARVEACFAAFVTNSDESSPLLDQAAGIDGVYTSASNPDALVSTLEPGMIKELRSGQDIRFAQPTTATQVEPMLLYGMMAMAAGLGITYDQLSGDLRQANYSSLRAGKLDFRALVEELQYHTIIPQFCQPIWDRFISRAIIAGELKERAKGFPCDWVTPAWAAVNPKFDYDAEQHVVRSGRQSPQQYIAEWGNDWRSIIDDWAEFNEYCDEKGVVFDIDPRTRTRAGSAQPEPKDPNAADGGASGDAGPQALFDESGNEVDVADLAAGAEDARVVPFSSRPRKREFDPSQPRDEDGKWTDGGGGDSGGGTAAPAASTQTTSKPSASAAPSAASTTSSDDEPKKPKLKRDDFVKAKINLTANDTGVAQVVEEWEKNLGNISPDEFKRDFLGGVDATMTLDRNGRDNWEISGKILNKDGNSIGTYTRRIDWANKVAESAYFQLNSNVRRNDIGKRVLAGNVDLYRRLGIERVKVHANIDVGGYAWAKYGYVPTRSSWSSLSDRIARQLGSGRGRSSSSGGGGNTYRPESWEEINEGDQEEIRDRWMGETRSEFYDNEVTNWRDNGSALDDAKYSLASKFDGTDEWAIDALENFRSDDDGIPYTNEQILAALSVEDYQTGYEGTKDPEFTFNNDKLKEPSNAPPPEQMNLPGIDAPDLSAHLTDDIRDQITDVLTKAFNDKAEHDADDAEPPDYLADSVAEYQQEYWDSMDDEERYRQAERNGLLPEYDLPDDEEDDGDNEPVEAAPTEGDDLTKLAASGNPKALWAIADNPRGKDLLLGSDWYGELNLNDKEAMDRFDAYVGKAKTKDAQVPSA